uniref:Ig-like domain-containing protein n=1 Tax=Terrapene triunguis TaxID=2587831 RepID=A0A674IU67_9SAUR
RSPSVTKGELGGGGPRQMPFSPAGSQPQIFTEPSSRALLGSGALLKCRFDVGGPIDLSSLRVQWHFWDQHIAVYNWGKGDSQVPRASLSEQELQRGNASLSLSNVTLADEGLYKFQLCLSPLFPAAPRIIVPQRSGMRFIATSFPCHVWGFYPGDVAITWLRDGQVQTESTYSVPQRNPDGTFNLTLTYTFTPMDGDRGSILTCRVSHAALAQPLQEAFALAVTCKSLCRGNGSLGGTSPRSVTAQGRLFPRHTPVPSSHQRGEIPGALGRESELKRGPNAQEQRMFEGRGEMLGPLRAAGGPGQ